ncbi:hypothetical protein Hanom_Chr00s000001g01596561 [Helianthus anomalus]
MFHISYTCIELQTYPRITTHLVPLEVLFHNHQFVINDKHDPLISHTYASCSINDKTNK